MDCPNCGGDNREDAHYCRHCGAAFAGSAVTERVPATGEQTPPLTGPGSESGGPAPPPGEPLPVLGAADAAGHGPEAVAGPAADDSGAGAAEPLEPGPEPAQIAPPSEASMTQEVAGDTPLPRPGPAAESVEAAAGERPPVSPAGREAPSAPASRPVESEASLDFGPETKKEESVSESLAQPSLQMEEVVAETRLEGLQPLTPVAPGTVIAGRYLVVEASDAQESEILYRAHDLGRCWQCGFDGNAADDAFCAQCGASLSQRLEVQLLEVRDVEAEPSSGDVVAARLTEDSRKFLLLARQEPEAVPEPGAIGLSVGRRSDAGRVRELNEDSLLVLTAAPTYESRTAPLLGLFSVADGMGGHEGGEVASKMALQVLAREALRTIILPELEHRSAPEEALIGRLEEATIAANDAVYLARQKRENDMGTTLTTALIRNGQLFLAHVGDCRAYRWNADGLQQLTTDHSLVATLVASGQAVPEEIYTHPHRSVIYRCIGDQPRVEVDTQVLSLRASDRIVICSDGLWEMIRDEGIQDVMMQEADPQSACDRLVNHANLAGGEDNISVIVVQVEIR